MGNMKINLMYHFQIKQTNKYVYQKYKNDLSIKFKDQRPNKQIKMEFQYNVSIDVVLFSFLLFLQWFKLDLGIISQIMSWFIYPFILNYLITLAIVYSKKRNEGKKMNEKSIYNEIKASHHKFSERMSDKVCKLIDDHSKVTKIKKIRCRSQYA